MFEKMINNRGVTEDLTHGQVAIIGARWVLVAAGLLLALWEPEAMGELRTQVVLILGLAVANFFLHSQVLMRKPVSAPVVYAASAADIVVISIIIVSQGGFESGLYVFYFPALLAISVAFQPAVTAVFAGSAMLAYGMVATATLSLSGDAAAQAGVVLMSRLLMFAAVAVCGAVYWRIERDRRREASGIVEDVHVPARQEVMSG